MDNIIVLMQFSYTSEYYKERLRTFIGEDARGRRARYKRNDGFHTTRDRGAEVSAGKTDKGAPRAKAPAQRNNRDIINLRRTQLTAAAYRVVSRKGYYNFTIKDIAREAGLSTGLVHYYFKDKQELLFTLLKEMNNNLRVYLNRALAKSDDPREKLSIFLDQAFNLVEREKDYFHVLIDFWTQINHNERIRGRTSSSSRVSA